MQQKSQKESRQELCYVALRCVLSLAVWVIRADLALRGKCPNYDLTKQYGPVLPGGFRGRFIFYQDPNPTRNHMN